MLAVSLLAALPLAACTDAGTVDGGDGSVATDPPTDVAPDTSSDDDLDATEVSEPAGDDPDATDASSDPADEDPVGSAPAAAALFFDDQKVPVAEACTGVDGAVVASTEGEVTIQVVLEGGEPAMRYLAEGEELYIEDVARSQVGATTVYEGTFEPTESEPFDVRFEVGDTSGLDDCG